MLWQWGAIPRPILNYYHCHSYTKETPNKLDREDYFRYMFIKCIYTVGSLFHLWICHSNDCLWCKESRSVPIQRGLTRHDIRYVWHIYLVMLWSLSRRRGLGLFCSNTRILRFVVMIIDLFAFHLSHYEGHHRNLRRPARYALSDRHTPRMILRKLVGPIKETKCKQQQRFNPKYLWYFISTWPGLNVKFVRVLIPKQNNLLLRWGRGT